MRWLLAVLCVCAATADAAAQGTPPPVVAVPSAANLYRPNAADEDWTFLAHAPKTDPWDPLKYIPLGRDWSLTLSGEFRLRPEGFRVRGSSTRPGIVDQYLLQRYISGADVRFGPRVRVFAEVQSGLIDGQLRSPRPSDEDALDLHQAFVEWRQPIREKGQLTLTAGRQELEIGSTRLISASPGLNIKRGFDGVSGGYRIAAWAMAGAVAKIVIPTAGVFNDVSDQRGMFWGLAAGRTARVLGLAKSDVGAYYLGIDKDPSVYAQGSGPERRHTVGLKWSGGTRLEMNHDVIVQWGHFAGAPVRAWGFATETAYRWTSRAWRPRVSARVDMASGDADASAPSLQSFNPLFPGNAYSGAVGLLGPTNLTDFTPGLSTVPGRKLVVGFEAPSYWRTSRGDGVYRTDLSPLVGPAAGSGKYVGTNPGVVVVWQATRHLQLQGAITRFLPGDFLSATFVAEGFGFYSYKNPASRF